jgi:phosphate transport system permease protein
VSAQISRSGTPGFESRIPNPESRIPSPESRTPNPESRAGARAIALRRGADVAFQVLALLVLVIALASLATLIWDIVADGAGTISWNFITSFSSRRASQAGIWHALTGSIFVIVVTALIAVPIGVAAAIYLEEYGGRSLAARLIELNITNLAAVPSIIYGLLGLGLFVRALGMGRSVLAGASTLALLVLPVVILSTREALRAVPPSIREGSYALGATKWQTVWYQVLPVAFPGILTGTILALSRAIGETAPLISIGALTFVAFAPDSIWSPFTVLPIQIFNWVSRPQRDFQVNAAAGILVLLALLLTMNAAAIWLRDRYQKKLA